MTFVLGYVGKNTALKNGYFNMHPLNLCVCEKLQELWEDFLNRQMCQQATVHPKNWISNFFASYRFLFTSLWSKWQHFMLNLSTVTQHPQSFQFCNLGPLASKMFVLLFQCVQSGFILFYILPVWWNAGLWVRFWTFYSLSSSVTCLNLLEPVLIYMKG